MESLRRAYEFRRTLAHARMRSERDVGVAMRASTPPAAEAMCPVPADPDARRAFDRAGIQAFARATGFPLKTGLPFRPALRSRKAGAPSSSAVAVSAGAHAVSTAVFAAASASSSSGLGHMVPLFPSASDALGRQGFARVINHSAEAGEVMIEAFDDEGASYGPLTLAIGAGVTVHFNSNDLEDGNAGKRLTGGTGPGQGDWRLEFESELDIEVLSYIRTTDGFLTAMHDMVPVVDGHREAAIFNPGSNADQESLLRLVNPGEAEAVVTISAVDDKGLSPGDGATATIPAGASRTYAAAELESGSAAGLEGLIGDGTGKWRLELESEEEIVAMSLLSSPTGHLTNLSTAPGNEQDGTHAVPLFPSAADANGRQGFARVANRSDEAGEVMIEAFDDTDREYEILTLSIGANETRHFNSDDLELGNADKGLVGSAGAGEGDWRLELTSELDIEVLSYIRTTDGFLTAMHDLVPRSAKRHRAAVFNPGSNLYQQSVLRLTNRGRKEAEVTIVGFDDRDASPGSDVVMRVPAGSSRTLTAAELEAGGDFEGALGDGAGKWRLTVNADRAISAMSLLSSPTGHLTNLSTAPERGAGPVETAGEAHEALISPIVQAKCVNCHVEDGVSGNTPLVFVRDTDADHLAKNLSVFENYLAEVEDGANRILNKIQGALAHGGGEQVASGTEEYRSFETLMELLGAEVESPAIMDLFAGVTLESPRRTLWRAAIVFAGRIPTAAEYAMVEGGDEDDLRRAIRVLMACPEGESPHRCGFHEFLIRGGNDRLLTDRNIGPLGADGFLVEFDREGVRLCEDAAASGDGTSESPWQIWETQVQYGAGRAPLELIAYVAENDRPYTEILTADYIMANPMSARAYGSDVGFDAPPINYGYPVGLQDGDAVHDFKPVRIDEYYLKDPSIVYGEDNGCGPLLEDPGQFRRDYPHAGILNTMVFLQRYPTTATNRNRARSRWTYYHFLGFDIEKSEARTMDPEVLKDRANPTMHNPACAACHERMDPVAGAFQNYGDVGWYLDQHEHDAIDGFYKRPPGTVFTIQAESWTDPDTLSLREFLEPDDRLYIIDADSTWGSIKLDRLVLKDDSGTVVFEREFEDPDAGIECEVCAAVGHNPETGEADHRQVQGEFMMPLDVTAAGEYDIEIVAWAEGAGRRLRIGVTAYRVGDRWYRDMREPGFGDEVVAAEYRDNSLRWLARRIVADDRFAEAAVKFWWPAIMGSKVAEQPEDDDHPDFAALKLAADAQSAEIGRLASGFRHGFGWSDNRGYNLKDLLVEIVMTRWFRAAGFAGDDPLREKALRDAGAERLLTPEELARKTASITGYSWGRWLDWHSPQQQPLTNLTNVDGYRLLFGGIDSDGIVDRAADVTPTMVAVAKSHASSASCAIVEREFYLLGEDERVLFNGLDTEAAPVDAAGQAKIRETLVDLHARLLGVDVDGASQEVESAYELFLDVWDRKRMSDDSHRFESCDMFDDADMLYFSGILEDGTWLAEDRRSFDWDVLHEFYDTVDWSDDLAVARTWVVVLAYLLSDYRYLYL